MKKHQHSVHTCTKQELIDELEDRLGKEVVEASCLAGSTRAVIGKGAQVKELLYEGEYIRLYFTNVSDWDELLQHIKRMRTDPPMYSYYNKTRPGADGLHQSGIVTFATKADAESVFRAMRGQYFQGGEEVNVATCVEQLQGSQVVHIYMLCVCIYE